MRYTSELHFIHLTTRGHQILMNRFFFIRASASVSLSVVFTELLLDTVLFNHVVHMLLPTWTTCLFPVSLSSIFDCLSSAYINIRVKKLQR